MAFGDFFLMISTSCLKKPTQERLRLFHSYAQARRRLIYQPIFKRQRSTLSMLFFGPKNGEHLHGQMDFFIIGVACRAMNLYYPAQLHSCCRKG